MSAKQWVDSLDLNLQQRLANNNQATLTAISAYLERVQLCRRVQFHLPLVTKYCVIKMT